MRRRPAGMSVSLFPFLAVLLCAMGALILLLLILTRQIREDALSSAVAASAKLADVTTTASDDHRLQEVPRVTVTVTPPAPLAPPDPNIELRARLAVLLAKRDIVARTVEHERSSVEHRRTELATLRSKWSAVQFDLAAANQRIAARRIELGDREAERLQLLGAIAEAKASAAAAQELALSAEPEFSIVPYDGRSGTTRRPILIECTANSIRFLPEDVSLSASDLEGFVPDYNPLLAGTVALCEHWREHDGAATRPYVLLLVHEDGIAAYYAARTLLSTLSGDVGYELITDEMKLAFPDVDPAAREACRTAVLDLLRQRTLLLASTTRRGERPTHFPSGRFEVDPHEHDPTVPPDVRRNGGLMTSPRSAEPLGDFPPQRMLPPQSPEPSSAESGTAERPPVHEPRPDLEPEQGRFGATSSLEDAFAGRVDSSEKLMGKRRWGLSSPSANISLERPVSIIVRPDEIIVGRQAPIPIGEIGLSDETIEAIVSAIDAEILLWGKAPGQFYWRPHLRASVRPGATRHFDRLSRYAARFGLRCSEEIALDNVVPAFLELEHVATAP